jgi:sugar phosphate permease
MGPRPDSRVFYGWWLVAVCFFANLIATGTHFYVINVFMDPLCQARGWTRSEINGALTAGITLGVLAQFVHGTVVMRVGSRLYMGMGAVISSLVFTALGRARSMGAFYALFMLLFFFNGAFGSIVTNTIVNNWFSKKKGRALGIATMGISLAGMVLPLAAQTMLAAFGLEGAFLGLGIVIFMAAPVCWIFIRNYPETYGLFPDGAREKEIRLVATGGRGDTAPAKAWTPLPAPEWTFLALVRSPAFWLVAAAFTASTAGVVGVMSQIVPRFVDLGFQKETAVGFLSMAALAGAAGKFGWGAVCDLWDSRRVAAALMVVNALGLALGLFGSGMAGAVGFSLLYGFAMGGVLSTLPMVVADLFGRAAFTSVLRAISLLMAFQGTGYAVMGKSNALTGAYDAAYAVFIALNLLAAVLLILCKRPAPGTRDRA